MSTQDGKDHYLPSRKISHAYAVAMHLGQQLEVNLRAVLYAIDHHGWGSGIELDRKLVERFKDTEGFVDRATCGLIIEKLRATGVIRERRVWNSFERACACRNKLAHSFLADQDFGSISVQRESEIIRRLHNMSIDLYSAVLISRAAREKAELLADEHHKWMRDFMRKLGIDNYDDPNRHYATKKTKPKSR